MFHLYMSLFVTLLFVLLTPGVLVSLPPKGGKFVVAATHAIVFSFVYYLTHKFVWLSTRPIVEKPPQEKK